ASPTSARPTESGTGPGVPPATDPAVDAVVDPAADAAIHAAIHAAVAATARPTVGSTADTAGSSAGQSNEQTDRANAAPRAEPSPSAADAVGRAIEMMLSAVAGVSLPGSAPAIAGSPAASVQPVAVGQSTFAGAGASSGSGADGSSGASSNDGSGSPPSPTLDAGLQLLAWLTGTSRQAASLLAGGNPSASAAASAAASAIASTDGPQSRTADASLAAALPPNAAQSAGAALAHLAAQPQTAAAPQATAILQAPVGTSAWIEELGAQLTLMGHRGIESASLHVSPAELGPIEVRISMQGRDASVWFGAAQAGTRDALQQALPQLQQLFASQGLALADTGVFREPPRQSARPSASSVARSAPVREASTLQEIRARAQLGLLDLYA
ncbi:MAG: flagellar hook-length control protein FliK, partial [Steroidobacteraceae bacterium]